MSVYSVWQTPWTSWVLAHIDMEELRRHAEGKSDTIEEIEKFLQEHNE